MSPARAPAAPGLDPGAAETCTADSPYVVAQPDIDNGKVVDTATATGTDTLGGTSPPSDPSTVTIQTVTPSPLVGIAKTGAVTPSGDQEAAQAGDTIQYSYLVTNTGNVTLTSVAVDDPTLGPTTCPTPAAPGLAPGSAETCTADAVYTVTQADVDRGSVTDTATATGTDARGDSGPAQRPVDGDDRHGRPGAGSQRGEERGCIGRRRQPSVHRRNDLVLLPGHQYG